MALRTEAILRIAIENQKIMAKGEIPIALYTSLLAPYIADKDNTASLLYSCIINELLCFYREVGSVRIWPQLRLKHVEPNREVGDR